MEHVLHLVLLQGRGPLGMEADVSEDLAEVGGMWQLTRG